MSSPLKPVFAALNRHCDVVERALRELVGVGDEATDTGIKALRDLGALRAGGEHGYRLHSRLREFSHDVLQAHPAFQSLAEIGSRIINMRALWNDLQDARSAGDYETADLLVEAIEIAAFDIGEQVERNLRLLGLLLSTRFGNVRTLAAKSSQNRFYQRQSASLADDLTRLGAGAGDIEKDARQRGLPQLAATLRNTLLSQLTRWTQTLSQYQTQISRQIFELREIERRNVLLARTALLLRQQPAWQGVEVDLPADLPPMLQAHPLMPLPFPTLRPHVEPQDGDRLVAELLQDEVRALPRLDLPAKPIPEHVPMQRLVPKAPAQPESMPADRALAKVARAVIEHARQAGADAAGLSLQDWGEQDPDARTLGPDVWLVFALSALRSLRFKVVLVRLPPELGERFRHSFNDALAQPTTEALKLYEQTLGRQRVATTVACHEDSENSPS